MTDGQMEAGSQEVKTAASTTMQRHHDFYVAKAQTGILPEEDKPNYALAMERERQGLVKPLVETRTETAGK